MAIGVNYLSYEVMDEIFIIILFNHSKILDIYSSLNARYQSDGGPIEHAQRDVQKDFVKGYIPDKLGSLSESKPDH